MSSSLPMTRQQVMSLAKHSLLTGDGEPGDGFGWGVSLDENLLVVGADASDSNRGKAYLFRSLSPTQQDWTLQMKLVASDVQVNDNFAGTVALDGQTVVAGAASPIYKCARLIEKCRKPISNFPNTQQDGANERTGSAYVFHIL